VCLRFSVLLRPFAFPSFNLIAGPVIGEGIASLKHAIELRADYDHAMAYLSLLYRRMRLPTKASELN
jgi:hypothetical protein